MSGSRAIFDTIESLTSHAYTEWLASSKDLHYECLDQASSALESHLRDLVKLNPDEAVSIIGPAVMRIASGFASLELDYLKHDITEIIKKGSDPRFTEILSRIDEAIRHNDWIDGDCEFTLGEIVSSSEGDPIKGTEDTSFQARNVVWKDQDDYYKGDISY